MRRDRFIVVAVAGLLSCLGWFRISHSSARQHIKGTPTTLVEAAEVLFHATEANYAAGRAKVEDIYRWSRRLMK